MATNAFSRVRRGRVALPRDRLARPSTWNKRTKKAGIRIKGWNGFQTYNAGRAGAHPYRATRRIAQERVPPFNGNRANPLSRVLQQVTAQFVRLECE